MQKAARLLIFLGAASTIVVFEKTAESCTKGDCFLRARQTDHGLVTKAPTSNVTQQKKPAAQKAPGLEAESLAQAGHNEVRRRQSEKERNVAPVWRQLKTYAYAQMPRHRSESFDAVWAPVVVKGIKDTIPGVGLAGRF